MTLVSCYAIVLIMNKLRSWLQQHIEDKQVTVKEFCSLVGLSRSAVYGYMSDLYRPSDYAIAKICKFLEIPVADAQKYYLPRTVGRPPGSKNVKHRYRHRPRT